MVGTKKNAMSRRDRKLYKKHVRQVCKTAAPYDNIEYLKRLYYAAVTMDMYKRYNKGLRRDLQLKHREGFFALSKLTQRVEELEEKIQVAQRQNWCLEQNRLWEPTKFIHFEKKRLAMESPKGPQSSLVDLRDESCNNILRVGGMARLIEQI